jgi:hypothetical protein
MGYIFNYDPQYSHTNFKESDIVTMIKKYELVQMTDWLKNGPPDKKRAAMAFKECLKNDWLVGLDLIVNSGWSKEKKLITDGWMELLCINLREKNKENSQSEQWLIQKTFNNKTLFSKSQLNKLSLDMLGFANSFVSQHYWDLFRPYLTNLIVVDGHHFFRDLYYHYNSPPYSPLNTHKKGTMEHIKSFHLANIEDVLKLTIHVDSFLIWDILNKDHNEEMFFKIIESPLFINSQELMALAIYVPMYYKMYKQNIKKEPKEIVDRKLERALKAFKKLNIPEYEEYTYHVINAYHSLVKQNNREHFSIGPFDLWNQSKLDYAYHLPNLNIKPNESVRVYVGDCFYAEPNANNEYQVLTEDQKIEYRQKAKNT